MDTMEAHMDTTEAHMDTMVAHTDTMVAHMDTDTASMDAQGTMAEDMAVVDGEEDGERVRSRARVGQRWILPLSDSWFLLVYPSEFMDL